MHPRLLAVSLRAEFRRRGLRRRQPARAEPLKHRQRPRSPLTRRLRQQWQARSTWKARHPANAPIQMKADPACIAANKGQTPTQETFVSEAGGLGNVFVYVQSGLNGSFPAPTTPFVFDQKGCRYIPHVFGVQVGQPIEIVNSDPTLHNIHATPKTNPEFNTAQPIQGMKTIAHVHGEGRRRRHSVQVRRARMDERVRGRARSPVLRGDEARRLVQHPESAARLVHPRGVAREARLADDAGDRRGEGIEVRRELHVQGGWRRELVHNGSVLDSGLLASGQNRTWSPEPRTENPAGSSPCGSTVTRNSSQLPQSCLIVAGGLVTSTGSGLAVPDWPTSYGWNMFTFPMKHMVGGIFYEHGHRLIASGVGFLTIILALWIWRAEPRRWMRNLGFTALGGRMRAGPARRHHGSVVSADRRLDGACRSRADLLLSDDRDFPLHLARMGRAGLRTRRRPDASARRHGDDGFHLPPDHRRRDDAAFRRRTGHSGFSARVRRIVPARVDAADCHPLRTSRGRAAL